MHYLYVLLCLTRREIPPFPLPGVSLFQVFQRPTKLLGKFLTHRVLFWKVVIRCCSVTELAYTVFLVVLCFTMATGQEIIDRLQQANKDLEEKLALLKRYSLI